MCVVCMSCVCGVCCVCVGVVYVFVHRGVYMESVVCVLYMVYEGICLSFFVCLCEGV